MTDWQNLWNNTSNVGHAKNSDDWKLKYAKELIMFLEPNNQEIAVDLGCGAGELLVIISKYYKKIFGIDFSDEMINSAKKLLEEKQFSNIELYNSPLQSSSNFINSKINVIYSNQVAQYLLEKDIEELIISFKSKLINGSRIYFFNALNVDQKESFEIGLYRNNCSMNWKSIIKSIIKLKWGIFKQTLIDKDYVHNKNLGYWHSKELYSKLAKKHNFEVEFFNAIYIHHSYRFHVKLTLNS
jgi:SAM-dependent methyltransferase